jgi:hypothetical protein
MDFEPHGADFGLQETLARIEGVNRLIRSKYTPRLYCGDVLIIRPDERNLKPIEDKFLGWRRFVAGRIEVFEVEGSHDAMFQDPAVGRLIFERIDANLRKSSAEAAKEPTEPALAR